MNLDKGKRIFYKYYGNHFYIDRETGNEYKKCKIPAEIEKEWLLEIKKQLEDIIYNSDNRTSTYYLMTFYLELLSVDEALCFARELLNKKNYDTFSVLIILEYFKGISRNVNNKTFTEINSFIDSNKRLLLAKEIVVDNLYKQAKTMRGYDFSCNALIDRIKNL